LASAVFQTLLQGQLQQRLGDHKDASKIFRRVRNNLNSICHLPPEWKADVVQSYIEALRGVFVVLFAVAVVGASMMLFMKEHVLHRTLKRSDSS